MVGQSWSKSVTEVYILLFAFVFLFQSGPFDCSCFLSCLTCVMLQFSWWVQYYYYNGDYFKCPKPHEHMTQVVLYCVLYCTVCTVWNQRKYTAIESSPLNPARMSLYLKNNLFHSYSLHWQRSNSKNQQKRLKYMCHAVSMKGLKLIHAGSTLWVFRSLGSA